MTAPSDPSDVLDTSAPSTVELDATDHILSELATGRTSPDDMSADPSLALLLAASQDPTEDELRDSVGFAVLAAAAANASRMAQQVVIPVVEAGRPTTASRVRKALAVKVALVLGVVVLGVAGAGAATGIVVAARSDDPVPTTVTSIAGSADRTGTDDLVGDASDGTRDRSDAQTSRGTDSERAGLCAGATSAPGLLALEHAADFAGPPSQQFCEGVPIATIDGNPDLGSTGATNGNNPDAGGSRAAAAPATPERRNSSPANAPEVRHASM